MREVEGEDMRGGEMGDICNMSTKKINKRIVMKIIQSIRFM